MIESLCDIGVVTESIFGVELGKGLGLGLLSARVRWNEKARDVDVMAPRQREALRKLHTLSLILQLLGCTSISRYTSSHHGELVASIRQTIE